MPPKSPAQDTSGTLAQALNKTAASPTVPSSFSEQSSSTSSAASSSINSSNAFSSPTALVSSSPSSPPNASLPSPIPPSSTLSSPTSLSSTSSGFNPSDFSGMSSIHLGSSTPLSIFANVTATSSTTPSPTAASPATSSSTTASSRSNSLSTGTVAGIVVAVGIALALIAALFTFLAMRRQNTIRSRSDSRDTKPHNIGGLNSTMTREQLPFATADDYLPQPADDKTVQTETKSLFDRIELFVENFCLVKPRPELKDATAQLSAFGSPHLPKPLASLLPRARDASFLIKHALAQQIMSRILTTSRAEDTLLPADLALLSGAEKANIDKPGFARCASRWRATTAYIRPDPSLDALYIADRDRKIAQLVQRFMVAFAPWVDTKYTEQARVEELTTVLQEAAGLGIFLLSQPYELTIQWPKANDLDLGTLAVTPALVKLTDEHGKTLGQAHVLVRELRAKL